MGTASMPDRVKPSFLICDIRAHWHYTQDWASECHHIIIIRHAPSVCSSACCQ